MSELDELRIRVDRIEAELAEVRARAGSAETLARFTDRDTSEIRASHAAIVQSLNALRETQVEQGRTLAEHSRTLAEHGRILAEHGRAHETTQAGIQQIISMLTQLGEQR